MSESLYNHMSCTVFVWFFTKFPLSSLWIVHKLDVNNVNEYTFWLFWKIAKCTYLLNIINDLLDINILELEFNF